MILRGWEFPNVWNASGSRGFFGEGRSTSEYWYHRGPWFDYTGSMFVAKTTTLYPRAGNMPLNALHRPRDWKPDCIYVDPVRSVVLNAVGLSGPGAKALLDTGRWLARSDRFGLSFMSVAASQEERLEEVRLFTMLLQLQPAELLRKMLLQLNLSCPNVGQHNTGLGEWEQALRLLQPLGVPVVVKFNALTPADLAVELSRHPGCDAITCSNTIPYGQLPHLIPWRRLFGPVSPLAKYGGGGLSGSPLTAVVADWIARARDAGLTKPVVACGGVLSRRDVDTVVAAGASGVELGSICLLRPWRLRGVITHANRVLG